MLMRLRISSINSKPTNLITLGLLLTSSVLAVFLLVSSTVSADALNYPWPTDTEAPCEFGSAGGGSCVNPNNSYDLYDWGVYISNVFHPYRNGYEYRNCTDYTQWKESTSPINVSVPTNWGNGGQWYSNAPTNEQTTTPKAWDAAIVPGNPGHVAFVESVNTDGTITISEYNHDAQGHGDTRTGVASSMGFTKFVDFGVHPSSQPTPPTFKMTSSTEDAPMAGDLNGDGNGDVIMAEKHANDNGVDLHVLFGANSQPFQYTPTLVRTFAAPTWDINRMKFVVGRFNSDQYADLAVFYRQDDGISTSVYIFYGAPGPGLPLQSNDPPQHYLLASDGWNWNTMKLVSGDVNGDGYDDVVVAAKLSSGGAGFHVLTGGVGSAALNNQDVNTSWRDLPAPAWYYDNMKLAAGPFNADNAADVAIVYNNAGINLHILNGGAEKFTNASTLLQTLPSGSGWNWNLVKLAAGQYNDDVYADLVLLHKDTDGGMAVHTFYGSGLSAAPFSSSWLPARTLTGTPGSGWSWDNVKLESGPVQMDNWSDIVLLHRNNAQDIDAHVLYGNPGNLMFNYNPTFIKEFTQAQGYNWSLMTPA